MWYGPFSVGPYLDQEDSRQLRAEQNSDSGNPGVNAQSFPKRTYANVSCDAPTTNTKNEQVQKPRWKLCETMLVTKIKDTAPLFSGLTIL